MAGRALLGYPNPTIFIIILPFEAPFFRVLACETAHLGNPPCQVLISAEVPELFGTDLPYDPHETDSQYSLETRCTDSIEHDGK